MKNATVALALFLSILSFLAASAVLSKREHTEQQEYHPYGR